MHICKFCCYQWDWDCPCETWSDSETGETHYCGNQKCPMCSSCQGNEATPERIQSGAMTRGMGERHHDLPQNPHTSLTNGVGHDLFQNLLELWHSRCQQSAVPGKEVPSENQKAK